MLPLAAAAFAEDRARWRPAAGSRSQNFDQFGFGVAPVFPDDAAGNAVPGCRQRNEDGLAVQPPDSAAPVGQSIDFELAGQRITRRGCGRSGCSARRLATRREG
jgi:hypothetical protein